jgi:putative lipase involved disintegration of autophagic bodies
MQIDNSKPLIITGNSLGGSVASLFTLSLLETLILQPPNAHFASPLVHPLLVMMAYKKPYQNTQHGTLASCM